MLLRNSITAFILSLFFVNIQAQNCTGVNVLNVDLRGYPAGVYISPSHSRSGSCCSSNNCTSFDVKLDTGAAMINLEILSGAVPTGSLFYKINCGPAVAVGSPICVNGQYTFTITFCKPGNNPNVYKITSISKPRLPANPTFVRNGCKDTLTTWGFTPGTISWTSVAQGGNPVGHFNSLLSSTTSLAPVYTPTVGLTGPVTYSVCGTPLNSICPGGVSNYCGQFTIINVDSIHPTIDPPGSIGFCAGGNVTITASATGGAPPYTFIWIDQNNNVVGTGSTYTASVAGSYQVDVRDAVYDATLCKGPLVSVPVTVTPLPTVTVGANQTVCTSSPTAVLTATVTNTSGVVWSGGLGQYNPDPFTIPMSYTPDPAEITAGFVNLTLTGNPLGGSCGTATGVVKIVYPPLLLNPLSSYSLNCNASTTVIATAASGGISPYTYSWNTGATTSTITAGEGNYCLIVSDAMGCTKSSCSNISVPTVLTISTTATDVTVLSGNDGTATAFPSGGTSPYTYLWSASTTSQTTQMATGLLSGTHSVLVTDSKSCMISANTIVNEPTCNTFSISVADSEVDCFGNATGSATVTATCSTCPAGPYTYSWDSGHTTNIVTGLTVGVYEITVTATNGCTRIETTTISEPPVLANSMSHTDVSLVGGSNGTATATTTGGTAPYTYVWSSSLSSTSAATGLMAGGYTVTITDANGCSLIDNVLIEQPVCTLLVLNMNTSNVSCFNGSNGTASANLLFGTAPYSYVWSVGGQTTSAISALPQGPVWVTVTDAVNCVLSSTVTITQPAALTLTLVATDVICNSANNGTLNLTVAGGTFSYSYLWNNNVTVEDQSNLPPGSYNVIVTDSKGCTATKSAVINQPAPIVAVSSYASVTCKDGSDGNINATVTGGITPYSYLWSNGATTEDITGLVNGLYILSVTDAHNCNNPLALNIIISEPDSVDLSSYSVTCTVPGSGVSNVDVFPIGGDGGPYTVSFNNGVSYLAPGVYSQFLPVGATYSVYVKDGNNCISSLQLIKVNPAPVISNISFPFCNPVGIGTATVTITPGGGAGIPYQVSTNNGVSYDPKGDYSDTLAIGGTYIIIIKDTLGCVSLPSTIVIPDSFSLSSTSSAYAGGYNISCNGLLNGSINLTVAGGSTPYTFLWNNGSTTYSTEDLTNVPAGTYSVLVTDSKGCVSTKTVTLTQPAALTTTIAVSSNYNGQSISCFGLSDGSIDLSVTGGTTAYTYVWSNSATTQDVSGLTAGTYTVITTDLNGCSQTNTVTLTQSPVLALTSTITHVTCNGTSNGSIDVTQSGGTPGFTYSWSNGSTTQDITGISAGSYTVTVTDVNGCTFSLADSVGEDKMLLLSLMEENLTCYKSNDGLISTSLSGGVSPYQYTWSNGATTPGISGLAAGTYIVNITDINNCFVIDTIVITQPDTITATQISYLYPNGFNISLNGYSDGSVDLSIIGGTSPYNIFWSTGDTTEDLSFVPAGNYYVQITDSNGCVVVLSMTLTEPYELEMPTGISPNGDGSNEYFVIHGLESYPDNELRIYNRWGNLVYTADDYKQDWNGVSNNGGDLPEATYFVVLKIFGTKEMTLTGYVDLRR